MERLPLTNNRSLTTKTIIIIKSPLAYYYILINIISFEKELKKTPRQSLTII